ncbi:DUF5317 family protein [Aedoeadaptatus coxii]|uniref:DUF5317 family protein n=1 Tax=Aedoeadaptatus coxii TaxID=755172 RepID=UPI002AD50FCE|nr:DUF5317 family protein [Peptoniphilus coxii]
MTKEAIILGMMLGLIFSWKNKVFLSLPTFKNLIIAGIGACIFILSLKMAPKSPMILTVFPIVHGIALVIIGFGLLLGKHIGYRLAGIGVLLNSIVVLLNGGMPVESSCLVKIGDVRALNLISTGKTLTHVLANEGTQLRFLCDRFIFYSPITSARVMSVGDGFIAIGMFIFVTSAVSYVFRRANLNEMDQ